MQNRLFHLLLPGFLTLLLAKTSNNPSNSQFVLSHNRFAFRMLENVLTSDSSNTNKLVSPLSLYLTMSMLCNGAVHDTRDSLMQVLQTGDLDLPNLNSLCKETLIQLPQEDGQVEFSLANAIWYNRRKLTLQ